MEKNFYLEGSLSIRTAANSTFVLQDSILPMERKPAIGRIFDLNDIVMSEN